MMAVAIATMSMTSGCGKVDTGEVGLKTRWGKISSEPLSPDLYYIPIFGGDLVLYDAREKRQEIVAPTFTKDMQTADIKLIFTFALDKQRIKEIHTLYGNDWAQKLVEPAVIGITKDVIGKWEADKLVNGREQAAKEINDAIKEALKDKPVIFNQLIISNIDFSDAFENAIEAKQIATQEAIKARNRTVQIEEESKQQVIKAKAEAEALLEKAKAEAEAMEVKGKALKENADLVKLNAIQKWNGTLPSTLVVGPEGGTLLNLNK